RPTAGRSSSHRLVTSRLWRRGEDIGIGLPPPAVLSDATAPPLPARLPPAPAFDLVQCWKSGAATVRSSIGGEKGADRGLPRFPRDGTNGDPPAPPLAKPVVQLSTTPGDDGLTICVCCS
ncbi:unnamed protein product, partial [Pylaiella littoralis]